MSGTVLDRAWDIYRYMHPDAPEKRKEQLDEYFKNSRETKPDVLMREGLAHLMKLDLQGG